jgi:hypothetical protein
MASMYSTTTIHTSKLPMMPCMPPVTAASRRTASLTCFHQVSDSVIFTSHCQVTAGNKTDLKLDISRTGLCGIGRSNLPVNGPGPLKSFMMSLSPPPRHRWLVFREVISGMPSYNRQAAGQDTTSFAHSLLDTYNYNVKHDTEQEWTLEDIKGAAGAIFIAGADTVSRMPHTVLSFTTKSKQ